MSSRTGNADHEKESSECLHLCHELMESTGVTMASAINRLQDTDWNVSKALDQFKKEGDNKGLFKVLSWNIDGLSSRGFETRMQSIAENILKENADIAFLQEVKCTSMDIIGNALASTFDWCFDFDFGSTRFKQEDYYGCAILWRKQMLTKLQTGTYCTFNNSIMDRGYLSVKLSLRGTTDILAVTSHLESTAKHSKARVKQLSEIFDYVEQARLDNSSLHVILGGDFNVRDKEFDSISIPSDVFDIWKCTGSLKECEFTWNPRINHNLELANTTAI
ncbi:hypothetical protein ACOME3_003958 [Neoechinorhynchus agilis]